MQAAIFQVSYLSCLGAYLLLCVMVAANWKVSKFVSALFIGSLITAAWAGGIAAQSWIDNIAIILALEIARPLAWLYFLSTLLGISRDKSGLITRASSIALIAAALILIIGSQTTLLSSIMALEGVTRLVMTSAGFLALTIFGLLMLENLYRNSDADHKWAFKYLCFGLGTIFIYDFFYYAENILFRQPSDILFEARGFINTLAVPLIGIAVTRAKTWSVDLHVSRNVVFHTTVLMGGGVYLLVMAGAGYYVRMFGGDWGTVFQITFSAGGVLLLIVLLTSSSLRGRIQHFISRNFFSTKYDYRVEWLRFSQTVSQYESRTHLHTRLLEAFAQIVDSRASALWTHDPLTERYVLADSWNFGDDIPAEQSNSPLIARLRDSTDILEINEIVSQDQAAASQFISWLHDKKRAWLIVPIHHHGVLIAFIILGQSRAKFEIDWADRELLMTVAEQAASYLSEEQATSELAQAKQFEDFNKRFAFVVHDLKNVINQLSLIVKNAEQHGHKPEFQHDMLETITSSVTRMNQLLSQLTDKQAPAKRQQAKLDLHHCLNNIAEEWRETYPPLEVDINIDGISVMADENRLVAAIGHLIQNALDATGEQGQVTLRATVNGNEVYIDIVDDGPGMSDSFVRNDLFRPMASTKSAGFGVGVYQVREYIYGMGGAFKVETQLDHGTTMRIILTLCQPTLAAE